MSWDEVVTLAVRYEFVNFAQQADCNISELCARFNISRKTGYKWLNRFREAGDDALIDRSRRPHSSPCKTPTSIEGEVLALREKHQAWGGRKLNQRLLDLGHQQVPAPSTITEILRRNDKLDPMESLKHQAFCTFEHEYPNSLWQMDFKGHFPIRKGRCHPLTVLDDHSRYNVLLKACADEKTETVRQALVNTFRRYGLPDRITMDNGSPWGSDAFNALTVLTAWLIRLGVAVSHSRPYHPQTQGKDERFHRSLNVEAIQGRQFEDLEDCQRQFNEFRDIYNLERPHESLGMKTPVTRYQPSDRRYPETLPPIEYGPDDQVRKVQDKGEVSFKGVKLRVPKCLRGEPVAFRPTNVDGKFSVYYCHHRILDIDICGAPL